MDTIYKCYKAEVKGFDEATGEVDMFIPVSTDSVDRDGEIVEPSAFKKTLPKYMKRPVLVASHDYRDLTSQIGEWKRLKITEQGLEGKPMYYVNAGNEQADWGFKLAQRGMAAFSIGFIPKEWEDGDGVKSPRRTYKEVELLEISQVIVPSNREAIQSIRSKSVDPIITGICDELEKELITKPEETAEYYRIPVPGEAGKHTDHKIRTIDIDKSKGIKALYCVDDKKNITFMFDKEKWDSMGECHAWMKDHMGKSFDIKKGISQAELADEIDYVSGLVTCLGVNNETKESMWALVKEILRLQGSDIPSDIMDFLKLRLVTPEVIEKPKEETLTYHEIFESIKRIGGRKC